MLASAAGRTSSPVHRAQETFGTILDGIVAAEKVRCSQRNARRRRAVQRELQSAEW